MSPPSSQPSSPKLSQLATIFWLRWRLLVNQFHRLGRVNRIATAVVLTGALLASISCFFVGLLGSEFLFAKMDSQILMLVWTGLGAGFLFAWSIGLLTDLQRVEPLALDKFLHLPVSPQGAFYSNFLSSILSISMILMFPILLGVCLGMIRFLGWHMLPGLALFFSFVFMVLAVTYQLKGWLAAMMVNPKRRRMIITGFTLFFVLLTQIPNVMNMTVFEEQRKESKQLRKNERVEILKWRHQETAGELTADEVTQRIEQIEVVQKERFDETLSQTAGWVRWANRVLPPGWMPLGMEELASKRYAWPLAALLGMIGIGAMSLRGAYRSTLRMYRGELTSQPTNSLAAGNPTAGSASEIDVRPPKFSSLFEKKIQFLNETQSSVFAVSLTGALRAPEVKLALLSPILIMFLMGISLAFRDASAIPMVFRSLTGIGVGCFALLGVMQIMNNQFGFDRSGFRTFLLSPASRRDILIGKNAALAIPTLVLGFIGICCAQFFVPMKISHFVASIPQMATMYLIVCVIGNWISIHCPIGIRAGSTKPVNLKLGVILLQVVAALAVPLGSLPLMSLPLIEYALIEWLGWPEIPYYLVAAFVVFGIALAGYSWIVTKQGQLLLAKEQSILEVVGNPAA